MKFTVVDPFERVTRIRQRGAVALIVRDGEPEVLLVPPPPERVVLEMGDGDSGSAGDARLRVIRLRGKGTDSGSEGLAGMLRRLADSLDPERDASTRGTGGRRSGMRLILGGVTTREAAPSPTC